jgi:hypothetical protein
LAICASLTACGGLMCPITPAKATAGMANKMLANLLCALLFKSPSCIDGVLERAACSNSDKCSTRRDGDGRAFRSRKVID